VLPPFGVCGGGAGATNRFWVRRGDEAIQPSALPGKVSGFPVVAGDILVMETSGGGGFGNALERDPAHVVADLGEGFVTRAAAEAIYGVLVTDNRLDEPATATKRAALRAARTTVRLTTAEGLQTDRGRSIRLDTETAHRLDVVPGAIVELVNPDGAPLRAWVTEITHGTARRAEIDADALRLLVVANGAEVEVRAVHTGTLPAATP
jgi:N-methylhydantoinase B